MTHDEPDFPAEDFDSIATLPQREMVERMKPFGWEVSHLWKRDEGDIVVWCITRAIGQDQRGYSHAFVEPGGRLVRYNPPRIRIAGRKKDAEADL